MHCSSAILATHPFGLVGETLGLVPNPQGPPVPYNDSIDRPDIRPAVEKALHHLASLLSKADIVTNRYELKEGIQADRTTSKGLVIFRERFEAFKNSLRKNQKQKSTWQVTQWAIHDLDKFRTLVEKITNLLDAFEGITSALGILKRQQPLLMKEVESVSDRQSRRLLQEATSSTKSVSLRFISDAASVRLSILNASTATESSGYESFHTAPSNLGFGEASSNTSLQRIMHEKRHLGSTPARPDDLSLLADVPQQQCVMAELIKKKGKPNCKAGFFSGDEHYGDSIAPVKRADDRLWRQASANLVVNANKNSSTARRVFLELRAIREANIPFISASPVGDSLSEVLASIEGPPDTPYEGGIFWISVKFPLVGSVPLLRLQTKIYHPNINHMGQICADFESWWHDPGLGKFMGASSTATSYAWFANKSSNNFSLGAILTALCSLLANPNIEDPLVPEVAEVYVTDYNRFWEAAKLYTDQYAHGGRPPDCEILYHGDDTINGAPLNSPLQAYARSTTSVSPEPWRGFA